YFMYPTKQFYLALLALRLRVASAKQGRTLVRPVILFTTHQSPFTIHLLNSSITKAVTIILINAKGINFFQPRFINWSYRKRGMVQRIQINTNKKKNDFPINTPNQM